MSKSLTKIAAQGSHAGAWEPATLHSAVTRSHALYFVSIYFNLCFLL